MDIKLSNRVQRIKPSPTLAISALANKIRSQGRDVIGLGAGEPDFDTPEPIKEAAIRAMQAGQTKYTAVDGTAPLKQAIIEKFHRDNDLDYSVDQILVSCGGKQSFYNLCQALLDEGDEVIIPAPYWVSYPDMALLAGGQPIYVAGGQEQGFKLRPEQINAAITERTRLIVINSPSNPSGAAYARDELQALAGVLERHPGIAIATDDMYEHILFDGKRFANILNVCPALYGRTVVLNGVSKAYAMTGWRIGYAGGPAPLIQAMTKIQSQSTSNPSSISQAAAQAALSGDQACVTTMRRAFDERRAFVVEQLNNIPGIECLPPDGTFYCFPNVAGLLDRMPAIANDTELAERLLDRMGVAVVPGSAFGLENHIRISFATGMDNLKEATRRIRALAQGSDNPVSSSR